MYCIGCIVVGISEYLSRPFKTMFRNIRIYCRNLTLFSNRIRTWSRCEPPQAVDSMWRPTSRKWRPSLNSGATTSRKWRPSLNSGVTTSRNWRPSLNSGATTPRKWRPSLNSDAPPQENGGHHWIVASLLKENGGHCWIGAPRSQENGSHRWIVAPPPWENGKMCHTVVYKKMSAIIGHRWRSHQKNKATVNGKWTPALLENGSLSEKNS